jgi:hypothetical protein
MFNLPRISFESFRFAEPLYLWLLIIPAVLFAVWIWRFVRRRGDLKRLRSRRALPVRERLGAVGDLAFGPRCCWQRRFARGAGPSQGSCSPFERRALTSSCCRRFLRPCP